MLEVVTVETIVGHSYRRYQFDFRETRQVQRVYTGKLSGQGQVSMWRFKGRTEMVQARVYKNGGENRETGVTGRRTQEDWGSGRRLQSGGCRAGRGGFASTVTRAPTSPASLASPQPSSPFWHNRRNRRLGLPNACGCAEACTWPELGTSSCI